MTIVRGVVGGVTVVRGSGWGCGHSEGGVAGVWP